MNIIYNKSGFTYIFRYASSAVRWIYVAPQRLVLVLAFFATNTKQNAAMSISMVHSGWNCSVSEGMRRIEALSNACSKG